MQCILSFLIGSKIVTSNISKKAEWINMNHLWEFVKTMNTADRNLMDFDRGSRKVLVKSHKTKFELLHIPGKIPLSYPIHWTI